MNSWQWVHFHDGADAALWHGDSFAWMRVALREDTESARRRERSGRETDHHRLNVALVCAGIAIELMYKVLLIADRVDTRVDDRPTHDITKLHGQLEVRKSHVEGILVGEGWSDVEAFLRFMDQHLNHADRKYWMSNPPNRAGREGVGFSIADGPSTVPGLARVHRKMASLVDPRALVAEYNLEHARVVTTRALMNDPVVGHKPMATRRLNRDGKDAEYTVYESNGGSWHVPDYVRGWWEMTQESGEPTDRFIFLLSPGEYDDTVDYWSVLAAHGLELPPFHDT